MMTATPALPASLSLARIATDFGWNCVDGELRHAGEHARRTGDERLTGGGREVGGGDAVADDHGLLAVQRVVQLGVAVQQRAREHELDRVVVRHLRAATGAVGGGAHLAVDDLDRVTVGAVELGVGVRDRGVDTDRRLREQASPGSRSRSCRASGGRLGLAARVVIAYALMAGSFVATVVVVAAGTRPLGDDVFVELEHAAAISARRDERDRTLFSYLSSWGSLSVSCGGSLSEEGVHETRVAFTARGRRGPAVSAAGRCTVASERRRGR